MADFLSICWQRSCGFNAKIFSICWRYKSCFHLFFLRKIKLSKQHWLYSIPSLLTLCSYHVTYAFQSESTLNTCLNVKELLARSRRVIWSLSDCNWTRTQNHLIRKRTLNHLAKLNSAHSFKVSLAKWLSVRLRTKWFWVRAQLQSLKPSLLFFVFFWGGVMLTISKVFTILFLLCLLK